MRLSFLLVLLAASGCSWATMTRPPAPPVDPSPPAVCTTSRLAPALDTVGAVLLAVPGAITTGYGIATPVCTQGWCMLEPQSGGSKAAIIGVGVLLLGLAAVETASAVTGYGWADGCEALKERQLSCLSGVEPSCAALRKVPRSGGRPPGSTCEASDECREGDTCYVGHCQPGARER
ncbi:MAG: hypothetical protein WB493_04420 [Anaeromyxobacteraceae bacterium]